MKRLTIRNTDGTVSQPTSSTFEVVFYRLAEYEDTGLTPEEIKSMQTKLYDIRQLLIENSHKGEF